MATRGVCAVEGCGKSAKKREWCATHYQRWSRHGDPLGGKGPGTPPGTLIAWIEAHLSYKGADCLIWPFNLSPKGYPNSMRFEGRLEPAHRVMCRRAHGPPPTDDHDAAHSCGRGMQGCISPSHLRWATKLENNEEKYRHGTMARGREVGSALTEETVLDIWRRRTGGGQRTVAAEFGVARDVVRRIWIGETWSWLTGASDDRARARRESRRLA